jgi:hypothetical protein
MRSELPGERDHGVADGLMLLTGVSVALATWSYFANLSTAPVWKSYGGVGLTYFLACAGLTRRAGWADAIRFMMGIWIITMPFLFGLAISAWALWICLTMGVLLIAVSVPGVIRGKGLDPVRPRGIWGVLSLPP